MADSYRDQKCMELHGLKDAIYSNDEEEKEKGWRRDCWTTFCLLDVAYHPIIEVWKIHQQARAPVKHGWPPTQNVSKQMALHDVIIISSRATKLGWSKQHSCHFPVERQNYGWHNRMAFDHGQKKYRWTKPCLYEGWAGWLARWMKVGSSGHIWTGKIKSWNPQADLSCSFWPCAWRLLLNQQLTVCANGKYNKFTLDSM